MAKRKNHPKDKDFINQAIKAAEAKCPDGTAIILLTKNGQDAVRYGANFKDRKSAIQILKALLFHWGVDEGWMKHAGEDDKPKRGES